MSVEAVAIARRSDPTLGIVAVWPAGIESVTVNRVVAPERVGRTSAPRSAPHPPSLYAAARRGRCDRGGLTVPTSSVPSPPRPAVAAAALTGRLAAVSTLLLVVSAVAMRAARTCHGPLRVAPWIERRPRRHAVPADAAGASHRDRRTGRRSPSSEPSVPARAAGPAAAVRPPRGAGTAGRRLPRAAAGRAVVVRVEATGNQGGGGPTISARARACRTAAGPPTRGRPGAGDARWRADPHLLEHLPGQPRSGAARALEKVPAANQASNGPTGLRWRRVEWLRPMRRG